LISDKDNWRVGFTSVGALTRNVPPAAAPPAESGRALIVELLPSVNAATNWMLRKAAIAGAFPDAAIVISAMAFLPDRQGQAWEGLCLVPSASVYAAAIR
jgi:hypothetical protein